MTCVPPACRPPIPPPPPPIPPLVLVAVLLPAQRPLPNLAEQRLHPRRLLEHPIHLECHGRRDLGAQPLRDGLAKISAGVIQPDAHAIELRFVEPVYREQRTRVA